MSLPLAGLMFDFLDGKVARWRKSSSMLGQELDSLADLVHLIQIPMSFFKKITNVKLARYRLEWPPRF